MVELEIKDLDVSYSPNYGSQAVASFTSSISEIVVSNTGLLSLNVDISGSATSSGDTITPTITWRDQYDNVGSTSITINVAANQHQLQHSQTNQRTLKLITQRLVLQWLV